jgi:Predicted transcriptional regulator
MITSEQFLTYVEENENGCWIVKREPDINGYCHITIEGDRYYAHRLAWLVFVGEIPRGLFVCHKCDVRNCANWNHLFLGTFADNMNDMWVKGRGVSNYAVGSKHPTAKVTESDVEKIRQLYKRGMFQVKIAKMFGISQARVSLIVRGEAWRHV